MAEERVKKLGLTLPAAPKAVATYKTTTIVGNLLYTSGHGPDREDGTWMTGKVGTDLTLDEGVEAARLTALSMLSSLRAALGSLDRIKRLIKVFGMVNASSEFGDHPRVINGFSNLMVEVFGDNAVAPRSAVGMAGLPIGTTVEIEAIWEIETTPPPTVPGNFVAGILTGISYQSGVDYYSKINGIATELVGKGRVMKPNPKMHLVSLDCDEYVALLARDDTAAVANYLASGVDSLVQAGANLLVIASNTGHCCVDVVVQRHPDLHILHIVDCVAHRIRAKGITRVGLVGTTLTMRGSFWESRLRLHGISCCVPPRETHSLIYDQIIVQVRAPFFLFS